MRFGICTGIDELDKAAAAGFDFAEPTIGQIAPSVSDDGMKDIAAGVAASPLNPEAFNCFIPGELKITGPDVDMEALTRFVGVVLPRASELGARVVVFGSGGARTVPDGYPHDAAMDQIAEFLRSINPIAAESGITVVIEPLYSKACNIINKVSEGYALAADLGLSHIKLLADLFHVGQESEPYDDVEASGELLRHVHISNPITRKCPLPGDGIEYMSFFRVLWKAGYECRISLECLWDDFERQAPVSLQFMREAWTQAIFGRRVKRA